MSNHAFALWFSLAMVGITSLSAAALVFVGYQLGWIRRSPLATRAEKNRRHLATAIIFLLVALMAGGSLLIDHPVAISWALTGVAFIVIVLPLRTLFVELGIRRQSPKREIVES